MNHLVDGHNLIARIPGLSLSMPDDEQRLAELLVEYCRVGGHKVEVYFDAAPAGQEGSQNLGRLRLYFVSHRESADAAIRRRVRALGKSAKNWLVVTSDRSVQQAAREAHAPVMPAEEFARQLLNTLRAGRVANQPEPDEPLSEAEVKEWEAIFKGKRKPY